MCSSQLRLIVPLFLFSAAVLAEDVKQVETMVVTASRTPVSINQAGSSITVLDSEYIRKRQVIALSDLLRDIPGLMVNRAGAVGAQTQIRIRGAEANQTMVFVDGVEVNDPGTDGAFDFAHLVTSNIDRVEVIRGPQSALWGSDALAGVINVITKRNLKTFELSGFTEGGSFDTFQGGGNIGKSSDNYHFNLSGTYLTSGGENISRQGSEDDGYENGTLTIKAGYTPAENLMFEVFGRHIDSTTEFDNTDPLTTLPVDTDDSSDVTQNYGRGRVKYSLLDQHWEHIFSAGLTSIDTNNFSSQVETGGTRGKKYKFGYQTDLFLDTPDVAQGSHILTLALEREKEKFLQRGRVTLFGDPNQNQEITTNSLIGEYRLSLWDKLSVSSSVRYDNNSDFKDATTYRLSASYTHDLTDTILHMSYGTGIKNPTFTERFGFFPLNFFGNPELRPEEARGWEIGIRQSLIQEKLQLGVTWFREELNDEINGFVFDPSLGLFGGFTAENTAGISQRKGAEVTAGISIIDNLRLTGNYTYVDSTQPDATGRQIEEIRRPRHLANINLDYTFLDARANFNFNINYNGSQKDDWFITFPATRVKLDSFTLINMAGSYQLTGNISVFGRVENLLDNHYEEIFGYRGNSRTVFAGLRMTFTH